MWAKTNHKYNLSRKIENSYVRETKNLQIITNTLLTRWNETRKNRKKQKSSNRIKETCRPNETVNFLPSNDTLNKYL